MNRIRAEYVLTFVTIVWGLAFIFQRLGAQHLDPFIFNALRYGLGGALTFCIAQWRVRQMKDEKIVGIGGVRRLSFGIFLGVLLFLGSMCQQTGLETTSAGKAGFLTTTYVVIVPFLSFFLGHHLKTMELLGAFAAVVGTYFLTINEDFTINGGDLWEIFGALWWGIHVLAISQANRFYQSFRLIYYQFFVCALFSLVVGLSSESWSLQAIMSALPSVLYSGIVSIALGYGLQVLVQHRISPARAATIFTMEAVFAALFGCLLLGETFTPRMIVGALLVLAGVLISQRGGTPKRYEEIASTA